VGFGGTVNGKEEVMAYRFQGSGDPGQSADILMTPVIALTMWNPFLSGAVHGNTRALGELGTIADEWQHFVSGRLKEDVALLQRLTRSTTPDQVIAAYTDFWHKAAEDYGNEITTLTKLMTDMTSKIAVATQTATGDASTKLFQRKAA
jgi:hypothetical protein